MLNKQSGTTPVPPNLDAAVASQVNLSNVRVDGDQDIDQLALKQAEKADSRNRERRKEKTARRFNGAVVEVRKGLFLYKISDDPITGKKGDRFNKTEVAQLQALIRATKDGFPFLDEMLAGYHPERNNDDNHWQNMRGLQGWLSGRKYYKQLRRGGFKLAKPASAYCARLAIAARPQLITPLEIEPLGGGGKRKRRKGRVCECCKKCAKRNSTPRKPVQSEETRHPVEVQQ